MSIVHDGMAYCTVDLKHSIKGRNKRLRIISLEEHRFDAAKPL
jgi:hypothetical protein